MQQRMFSPLAGFRRRSRPRLLVEDPNPALHVSEFRFFEGAGFDVALCSGPCRDDACPLVQGGGCQLIDCADVVLMGPGMADHRAEVAAGIHRRRPGLPVVVQIPRADAGQCPAGCIPDTYPVSVEGQVRALWRALDRPPADRSRGPVSVPGANTPNASTASNATLARLVDLLGW